MPTDPLTPEQVEEMLKDADLLKQQANSATGPCPGFAIQSADNLADLAADWKRLHARQALTEADRERAKEIRGRLEDPAGMIAYQLRADIAWLLGQVEGTSLPPGGGKSVE